VKTRRSVSLLPKQTTLSYQVSLEDPGLLHPLEFDQDAESSPHNAAL
jgi:hypothetical protein